MIPSFLNGNVFSIFLGLDRILIRSPCFCGPRRNGICLAVRAVPANSSLGIEGGCERLNRLAWGAVGGQHTGSKC